MIARDVMTREVLTVPQTSTLAQALAVMSENDIRHVPVVDDTGALAGIVSERDLRRFHLSRIIDVEHFERARARLKQPLSEIMSSDVVTIDPETDLSEVIELMLEEKVGAIPVVDSERDELVGIVSYVDVLRAAQKVLGED